MADHAPGRGRREHPSPRVINLSAADEAGRSGPDRDSLRVLIVEDDALVANLIMSILEQVNFDVEHVSRLTTALARLVRDGFDLVVTDLNLADSSGPDTVRFLRRAAPSVPVIVLSGIDDVDVAIEAIHEGADEYVVKGRFSVESLVWLIRMVLERHRVTLDLQEEGYADPLSGLVSRPALSVIGRHLMRVADRTGLHLGVVFVALSAASSGRWGDWERLLLEVRDVLVQTVRRCDLLSHVARGELAILLISEGPLAPAVARLEHALADRGIGPFVRIGFVAHDPNHRLALDDLLARARDSAHPVLT
jgi:ActR/RegA family two-component response regulator